MYTKTIQKYGRGGPTVILLVTIQIQRPGKHHTCNHAHVVHRTRNRKYEKVTTQRLRKTSKRPKPYLFAIDKMIGILRLWLYLLQYISREQYADRIKNNNGVCPYIYNLDMTSQRTFIFYNLRSRLSLSLKTFRKISTPC